MTNDGIWVNGRQGILPIDNDLISFIIGYVFDKGGRCLRKDLIRELVENMMGMRESFNSRQYSTNTDCGNNNGLRGTFYRDMDERVRCFEENGYYETETYKGLTFERSTMTHRIIYKYVVEDNESDNIVQ